MELNIVDNPFNKHELDVSFTLLVFLNEFILCCSLVFKLDKNQIYLVTLIN